MSSIYRKGGQDGVYYYQTYVYNPETKKKDKRIFHSLSTKDQTEAEKRQSELDVKYEEHGSPVQPEPRFSFLSSNKRSMALIFVTVAVTVFVVNLFRSSPPKQAAITKQPVAVVPDEKVAVVPTKAEETLLTEELPLLEDKPTPVVKKSGNDAKFEPKEKIDPHVLTIPKYTVQRVENISSVFHQGKVYVTVDVNTSTERLRLLCKSLTTQYPEFSNIVICLYASSPVGIELAKGTGENFSVREQNEAWLVMYSYNPVEGDYFDDDPGKYLGS